jgi:opacity protein-like surface antigen
MLVGIRHLYTKISLILGLSLLGMINCCYARPQIFDMTWQPVVAVGGGVTSSSGIGDSQTYPIQNPATDEYYIYTPRHFHQTPALFEAFAGGEGNLMPYFLLQAGFDYTQAASFSADGTLIQGTDSHSQETYRYHYSVLTRQLLAEGKLLLNSFNPFHPYVLAGLGVAINKASDYYISAPVGTTFTRLYQNNTATSFTYTLGAGIDVDVTNNVRFGVGYRFSDLGTVQLGKAIINNTQVSGSLAQSSLYTNAILAQITWVI